MKTFSVEDFESRQTSLESKAFFTYIYKSFSPVKKQVKWLPMINKYGVEGTHRVEVRYFDCDKTIQDIQGMIDRAKPRQKMHVPKWERYQAMIQGVRDGR